MSNTSSSEPINDYYSMCGTSLPADYQPCADTVIIGRGRKAHGHEGNIRFQALLQSHREEYEAATSRSTKTAVIMKVVQKVKESSQNHVGFVKKNPATGHWIALQSITSRTSVGQAFRDLLKGKYKSSKHFKQVMRETQRNHQEQDTVPQKIASKPDVSSRPFTLLDSMQFARTAMAPLPSVGRMVSLEASVPALAPLQQQNDCWVESLCALLPLDQVQGNQESPFEPIPLKEVGSFTSGVFKPSLILDDESF